jgi:ribosome-associated translation inhibitor RaiA
MQTPVEIEFQDVAANPAIEQQVADQVKKLETRYGRITASRVVVKGPGTRHETGGQYDINIRMAAKLILGGHRRRTNGIPIWRSPSTMRSSGHAGACRTRRG